MIHSSRATKAHSLPSSSNVYAHGQGTQPPATLPQLVEWEAAKVRDFVFRRCHRTQISTSGALGGGSHNMLAVASSGADGGAALLDPAAAAAEVDPPAVPRSFLRAVIAAKYGPTVRLTADGVALPPPASALVALGNPAAQPQQQQTTNMAAIASTSNNGSSGLRKNTTVRIHTPSKLLPASSTQQGGRDPAPAAPSSSANQQPSFPSKRISSLPALATGKKTTPSATAVATVPPPRVALLSTRDRKPLRFYEMQILMDGEWRDFLTDSYGQRPAALGTRDRAECAHQVEKPVLGELDRSKNPLFFLAMDITPHELDLVLAGAVSRAGAMYAEEARAAEERAQAEKKLLGQKLERDQKLQLQMEEAKKKMAEAEQQQQQQPASGSNKAAAGSAKTVASAAAKKKAAATSKKLQQQAADHDSDVEENDESNKVKHPGHEQSSAGGGTAASSRRKQLRQLHAAHQRAFNIVADAIFAERDRRVKELRKTVPTPLDIRPHDDEANGVAKSKKFYGHKSAKPYGKIATYDDPRDVQRSLHRHAFEVISIGEGETVGSSMMNLRCLRDEYDGACDGRAGFDNFCALRYKVKKSQQM